MKHLLVLILFLPCAGYATSTVAISYFDNNSGQAELDPLSKGLADMLITDLSNVASIQIVERAKLNQVLSELKLSKSKFIDPRTAQKLGKGVAAAYVMSGSYTLVGDQLRIDARIVRVDTGVVTASEKVEGKKDEFFALEKELVDVLVRALGLKLGQAERMKLRGNATQSFQAWAAYSAGLDAVDHGDSARARQLFEAALRSDPGYQAAHNARERLTAMFEQQDRVRAARADEAFRALDPRSPKFGRDVEALLVSLDSSQLDPLRRKYELLLWLGERDLVPCPDSPGRAAPGQVPTNLVRGVPVGAQTISNCRPAHEILLVAFRFTEDPDMWEEVPKVCEYLIHRLPNDSEVMGYCRMLVASVDESKAQGREAALTELRKTETDRANLTPNDWRMLLLETTDLRKAVMRLYAKKARGAGAR